MRINASWFGLHWPTEYKYVGASVCVQIHVVSPHDERQKANRQGGVNQRLVSPNRFARVIGDDLRDDPHGRQNQHIHFRVAQKPEQVLPQAAGCRRRSHSPDSRQSPGRSAGKSWYARPCP